MSEQQPEADANTRLATASRLISNACAWSAGVGLIPLPIVDVAALAVVQVKLADDIARLYGQRFTRDALKGTVAVLLSTIVPTGVAGAVGGSLKFVPGIGTTVGVLSQPAFGAAATYALGRVLVRHFEFGGTTMSFRADAIHEDLKKEFDAARAHPA
jgi:uncharacterized protein (DUF697 family)